MLPSINIAYLGGLLLLCLPIYLLGKYLEKKLQPKTGGVRFTIWLITIVAMAMAYYFLVLFIGIAIYKP